MSRKEKRNNLFVILYNIFLHPYSTCTVRTCVQKYNHSPIIIFFPEYILQAHVMLKRKKLCVGSEEKAHTRAHKEFPY